VNKAVEANSNSFVQLSLAWWLASLTSTADVSLKTSSQNISGNMIHIAVDDLLCVLNDKYMAGCVILPARLPGQHCYPAHWFVSQIPSWCDGIFNDHFIGNFLLNVAVKTSKISEDMDESLAFCFYDSRVAAYDIW